jgi:hypothetical protein
MNRNRILALCTLAVTLIVMTSCGITSHPNERIIIGTWKPVSVEKVVDSAALKAAATLSGNPEQKQPREGRPAGDGGVAKKEAALDRLVQSEMRATMEIFANKTAVKNYPGKPMSATWKMKGKGTRIVAKGTENNVKFVIEILEINKERIVMLEHAPIGDIKIVYERQQ